MTVRISPLEKTMRPEKENEDDLCEVRKAAREFAENPHNGPQVMQGRPTTMCRQSAVGMLRQRAHEARRTADRLEALAGVLPADLHGLSPEADEALWELARPLKV